jgi:hypothetical protein
MLWKEAVGCKCAINALEAGSDRREVLRNHGGERKSKADKEKPWHGLLEVYFIIAEQLESASNFGKIVHCNFRCWI